MLVRWSALLRLLTLTTLLVPPAILARAPAAFADDDDEEEEGGGSGEEGAEEEEEETVDPDQPAVTAGGLYTIDTYPQSEVERPLTLTQKVFEGRVGIGFDLSKGQTFDTWVMDVKARYGIADTLEGFVTGAFMVVSPSGSAASYVLGAGAEFAIVYDLVDFRGTLEIPVIVPDGGSADANFDLVFGFPVKYRLKKNIAVFALDRFFVIHTAGGDPDLQVGFGGIFQAAPVLALYLRGDIILPQFDTGNLMTVPATAGLEFAPTGKFDLGAEFVLGNLKVEDPASPFDSRRLQLYVRARF